jgi:cell division protein FtsW
MSGVLAHESPPPAPPRATRDAATLLAIVLALMALGLVMVYSTTVVPGEHVEDPGFFRRNHLLPSDDTVDSTHFFRRQVLWTLLAGIALAVASQTDYRAIVRWRRPIVFAVMLMLLAVLATHPVKGARRWFELGAVHIQPSELAKIALVFFLAGHCAEERALASLRRGLPAFGAIAVTIALLVKEPDYGTGAFVGMVGALMLLVAGVRLGHAALLGVPAIGAVALYAATHAEHVRTRIQVFLDPGADPLGKGFQINQALIALGSGGPLGFGLGESRQKLFFLPDDHTDFILAIVGEELGLFGTLLVAALFAAFVVYGIRIALRARDRLGFLVGFGVTTMIGLQAAMNIAVVTASMPTKGISLPFVSFGGSSLLIAASAVGVLLNIARNPAPGEVRAGAPQTRRLAAAEAALARIEALEAVPVTSEGLTSIN